MLSLVCVECVLYVQALRAALVLSLLCVECVLYVQALCAALVLSLLCVECITTTTNVASVWKMIRCFAAADYVMLFYIYIYIYI